MVARRRYQTGCLFKRGKRRKVWVARWREDVLLEGGRLGRLHKSVVLGTVADLPTRRDALTKLDEHIRPVNQGTRRPEALISFGVFVETQWSALVLPTLKLSTQHGYKNVLNKHVLPYWRAWRLRDIGKLDVQQFVAETVDDDGSGRFSGSWRFDGRKCSIHGLPVCRCGHLVFGAMTQP